MIVNISNEIYTKLKTDLTGVTVLPSYPSTTPTFPCVIFEENSNNTFSDTVDSAGEKHNVIDYEINIFSNSQNKIAEVRDIREQIDLIMTGTYNMDRMSSGKTPNYADTNVYRYTLRYETIADVNKVLYRR